MKYKKSFLIIACLLVLSSFHTGAFAQSPIGLANDIDINTSDIVALEEHYAQQYGTPYFFSAWKHDPSYSKHCQEQWGLLKQRIQTQEHPYKSFFSELADQIEGRISFDAINSQHIIALAIIYLYWKERYEGAPFCVFESSYQEFIEKPSVNTLYTIWNEEIIMMENVMCTVFDNHNNPTGEFHFSMHFWPMVGQGDLSLESLTKYFLKGIFPVGIPNQAVEADGELMSPSEFTRHDIGHAKSYVTSLHTDSIISFLKTLKKTELFRQCLEKRLEQEPTNKSIKKAIVALFFGTHEKAKISAEQMGDFFEDFSFISDTLGNYILIPNGKTLGEAVLDINGIFEDIQILGVKHVIQKSSPKNTESSWNDTTECLYQKLFESAQAHGIDLAEIDFFLKEKIMNEGLLSAFQSLKKFFPWIKKDTLDSIRSSTLEKMRQEIFFESIKYNGGFRDVLTNSTLIKDSEKIFVRNSALGTNDSNYLFEIENHLIFYLQYYTVFSNFAHYAGYEGENDHTDIKHAEEDMRNVIDYLKDSGTVMLSLLEECEAS